MRRSPWTFRLLSMQQRADSLIDRRQYVEARDLLLQALGEAQRRGVESAHLRWLLVFALDGAGDERGALVELEKAIALDPLARRFHDTLDQFTAGLRRELADPEIPPDDPRVPVRYDLLLRCGAADAPSHLAMARYCERTGDLARARRLLDSLVALDPFDHGAWALLESVARGQGDEELAKRAAVEAAATRVRPPAPFAIAGTAEC
jgi:tetratricopeptide (TPR) repeat protein